MYQFRCDSDRPQDLFLLSSKQKPRTIQQKNNGVTKDIKVSRGDFNYILQDDTIVDLQNNIPFLFSDYNERERKKEDIDITTTNFAYVNKIYKDTSRFLSIYSHHHLVFSHTKRETLLWKDIVSKDNKAEVIETSTVDILRAFRV